MELWRAPGTRRHSAGRATARQGPGRCGAVKEENELFALASTSGWLCAYKSDGFLVMKRYSARADPVARVQHVVQQVLTIPGARNALQQDRGFRRSTRSTSAAQGEARG
eukprot:scaffold877_cov362-Prasinococcus_capsulatus_cf.AAC.1